MQKVIIVGGNFGENPKSSSVVTKISDEFRCGEVTVVNGGTLDDLPEYLEADLSVWMPNIENTHTKSYPNKKKGSVLVCSKVMRPGYKDIDAVSRIFKMHGNAVIAIYQDQKPFRFHLLDALGNTWYDGRKIEDLVISIERFYKFTKEAVRKGTVRDDSVTKEDHPYLKDLIEMSRKLSSFIQTSCGDRFFGNISTRCQKLFPSCESALGIYVSPRNVDKEGLSPEDMVFLREDLHYPGERKPSVDSPCQLEIYKNVPNIHYLIHGHAFIKGAPTTKEYRLCGDVREASEVIPLMKGDKGCLNLKNHGFLLYSKTLLGLGEVITELVYKESFTYERH